MQEPQLVGYGVDILILNMRYTDEKYQLIKKELAEEIMYELDELQGAARRNAMAMIWLGLTSRRSTMKSTS
jgi:hypothetical protein